ncbi:polysaccharide deacetylase family protein [Leucobacter chinensis]|uniref:polysaccharide deacetylase family protein n=1 Tax=Leucobacter chinensis TaxID=2851010 RepID=UPI001C248BD3|nr:polysaccharide deacetylase [Leucobacter chinensis]
MSVNQEPWQWPEPVWRGHINRVRAGRRLVAEVPEERWPGGAEAAVLISFDSDHETPFLRDGNVTPAAMGMGEYGARVAVPRILALLERHAVPASFFIPAVCALQRPDEVPGYVERGHEVGVHGWIHERNSLLPREAERDLLARAADVLEMQAGVRPVGIRTPSWDFSPHTLDIIRELGFHYDSSLMADDEPYELLAEGEQTGIIEIPVEWIRDDAPFLMMDRFGGLRPTYTPRELLQVWKDEFDGALAEGGVFNLTLHPHIIGHRSRLFVLDELLSYISQHRVWYATHAQLASHVAPLI